MKGRETITDIYNALEGIEDQLARIAGLMEADHKDRKAREAAEPAGDKLRAEQEERELAEAETRYPGITAEVRAVTEMRRRQDRRLANNTAFVPPF